MSARIALILVQALGALSLIPYPAILLANIMSMAATGPRGVERLPLMVGFGLLSLYPLLWVALFVLGWRALGRGATAQAFALSAIPLAGTALGLGMILSSNRSVGQIQKAESTSQQAIVEKANPLVWTILCADGANRLPGAPRVSIEAAIQAIDRSDRFNDPAPGYGTPLATALRNLKYNFDGSPYDRYQTGLERVVRALVARGARMSPDENQKLDFAWRLKRATFDGPITTRDENPLVWRILETADPRGPYMRQGKTPEVGAQDAPLLNKPTRLHGTPLYAAMRLSWDRNRDLVGRLIYAGARLSPEEMSDPAAAAGLQRLFADRPDLQTVYQR